MPLHDWSKLKGWSGLHIYWMVNICDDIKSKLPAGFRACPDKWPSEGDVNISIERNGRLIAAAELVSPGNKDGTEKRSTYTSRYLSYLTNGVHLLFVDLHPRPYAFSFADEIAKRLHLPKQPALRAPYAISYRVHSDPAAEATLAVRHFPMKVGETLPTAPLALGFPDVVQVDLEETYSKAAESAYVE